MSTYLEQGEVFLEKKEYTKALEFFQAALIENPNDEQSLMALGRCYLYENKITSAKKTFFSLLSINPNHHDALVEIKKLCYSASSEINSINVTCNSSEININFEDPVVNIIPPQYNGSECWLMEQQSGNRLFFKVYNDSITLLPPCLESTNNNVWDGFKKPIGQVVIPPSIKINQKEYKIRGIGNRAFLSCHEINGITIPSSITSIGWCAFSGTNISNVFLPDSILQIQTNSFGYCGNLENINIPSQVGYLRKYIFSKTKIAFLEIPENINKIEDIFGMGGNCSDYLITIKMNGTPPIIDKESLPFNIRVLVPSNRIEQYRNSRFWQTLNLIPY